MSNKLKPLTLIQNDLPKLSLTEKNHFNQPTIQPTHQPTVKPTVKPTIQPTTRPSARTIAQMTAQSDGAEVSVKSATQMIEPSKSSSEKQWRHLKSELNSALSQWSELENVEKKKTPEEEQLEKMRGLLSNLKDRLLEF